MSRSKWKGPVLQNIFLNKSSSLTNIKFRHGTIPSLYLDKFINIYTGKEFKKIYISKEKIGIKFGSFVYTRGKVKNKSLRKKK